MQTLAKLQQFIWLAVAGFMILACATPESKDVFFHYDGKRFKREDLSNSAQQKIYSLQAERYSQLSALFREEVITLYLTELAAEQKATVEELRARYFPPANLSDATKKQFYEQNKDKIPYPYDMVESEIETYITSMHKQEAEARLLKEIAEKKMTQFFLDEPRAPIANIMTEGYATKGASKGAVTIVEYGDFSCPTCRALSGPLSQILDKYNAKVKFVFKYYSTRKGLVAERLAASAHCALKNNKFWQFHDYIFAEQNRTFESSASLAKTLDLNADDFTSCVKAEETQAAVAASYAEAERFGIDQTPTFFINGKRYMGRVDVERLEGAIRDEL